MSTKVSEFVSRISRHFPPAKFESAADESEWLESIIESLKSYDESVLRRAAQRIIDTRGLKDGEKWFPLPAAIRKVCNEIIDDDRRVPLIEQAMNERRQPDFKHSHSRTRLVIDLVKGEMGRRAAREGWIGQLVDHVRAEMKLPGEHEVGRLQKGSREFMSTLEACHRADGWPKTPSGAGMATMCARLGETIERRNKLWAGVVLGQIGEEALFKALPKEDGA